MILTLLVIVALAVVQSLFGIGLLVFGTPTLLLLGHSFADTLAILLPASITISVLQVWQSGVQNKVFVRSFAAWCLVPLVTALAAVLVFDLQASLHVFVAVLLAVFVALRLHPEIGERVRERVAGHERLSFIVMGAVHGLSNLGGALLLIVAASRFRDKEGIRALIAFCYACFAATQLAVLAVLTPDVFGWSQVGYAAMAAGVFWLVGQRVFLWVSAPVFDWLLTCVAGAYAGLLCLRSAGLL